jgi:hypothetical protein
MKRFDLKTILLLCSLLLNALGVSGVLPPAAVGTGAAILNALTSQAAQTPQVP